MARCNFPSALMAYFNVTIEEFQEFWKSLSEEEKQYYRYVPLV